MPNLASPSTARTANLVTAIRDRGLSDRSGEWFRQEMFPSDIAERNAGEPIIVRRALAFQAMLRTMTDPSCARQTRTYSIGRGELIVGVTPMGSVGLGKEFPRYLLEEERRLAMMTSRDEESMFGHNCPDHGKVLRLGLDTIADTSRRALEVLGTNEISPSVEKQIAFHRSVIVCCEAVVEYARRYSQLARALASEEQDARRRAELESIAERCERVPAKPARFLHDALQCVWFIHLALHATLDFVSPGRLDQLLQPYLAQHLENSANGRETALELIECFLIKGAERLNLTTAYLKSQDHQDFGTGLGTSPVFLDQIASANNFMQNIVLGGVNRRGEDATNDCTYLFLQACANVGLPTPVVVLRVHDGTPPELLRAAGVALATGRNGLPILYNDETIIPGLCRAGVPLEEARDYVVDGCWEPILNATGDWTFGMVNVLTVLECALNSGCLLTTAPSQLRGQKRSFATKRTAAIDSFEVLQQEFKTQLQLHIDKVGLSIFDFYQIDGSVTPTPFLSALISSCQERGMDKTWGGADFILGGIIGVGMPNCANALIAIRRMVFENKAIGLEELVEALRNNFDGREELRGKLLAEPKFGNGVSAADGMMKWLCEEFEAAVNVCKSLAAQVFRDVPEPAHEQRIREWRSLAGYEGPSMRVRFGDRFDILFTSGLGTFGQYVSMGQGVAASADGRMRNAPVAPNCSPSSGTATQGLAQVLESMGGLPLDRYGAGAVLDVCLAPCTEEVLGRVVSAHVTKHGNILTVSVADKELLERAHAACVAVEAGKAPPSTLEPYAVLSVRVGGWNAPFISMSQPQREDYLARHMSAS